MAELITGRGGTDHVDSEDFGAFNAVTLGDGTYILSGCSMAMKTATTLHIAAGELLMQGRHVRIKGAGEDVVVAVGTTGYNRNDIVALHYKQEGGIESVSVEVVAGTPTTGAASDPELGGGSILNGDSEAYAAIARVPIAGLAPSEPVVLVGGLKSNSQLAESVSALGDSVSLKKVASGTSSIAGGGFAWTVYFIQPLRLLMVSTVRTTGYMKTSAAGSQSKKLCTLASGYRPSADISMCPFNNIGLGHELIVDIEKTGEVTATVNYSKAMADYGFPNTTAFFLI